MENQTRKAFVFVLEMIYEVVKLDEEGKRYVAMEYHTDGYQDDKRSVALNAAKKDFNKILKEGLKFSHGSVIESIILPSSIKQIGIIDLNKYEAEKAEMEAKLDTLENGYSDKIEKFKEGIAETV